MISANDLIVALGRNAWLVKTQADGLTNEDSLRQPPLRGNCLNRVVGHLAQNRDRILDVLGAPPIMADAGLRYQTA